MMEQYPSLLLESAVDEFAKLPGIGRKTALRLVLHLLRQETDRSVLLGESLIRLRKEVKYCKTCHNISDTDICSICSSPQRDPSMVCIVENVKEVMVVEGTRQFRGLYHVLGGLISPMEGIGPSQLQIDSLLLRISNSWKAQKGGAESGDGQGDVVPIKEVILALSTTMEGDTTNFYIFRRLQPFVDEGLKVTTLARGVSVGDEIEYADEVTLGRSIATRVPFADSINRQ